MLCLKLAWIRVTLIGVLTFCIIFDNQSKSQLETMWHNKFPLKVDATSPGVAFCLLSLHYKRPNWNPRPSHVDFYIAVDLMQHACTAAWEIPVLSTNFLIWIDIFVIVWCFSRMRITALFHYVRYTTLDTLSTGWRQPRTHSSTRSDEISSTLRKNTIHLLQYRFHLPNAEEESIDIVWQVRGNPDSNVAIIVVPFQFGWGESCCKTP